MGDKGKKDRNKRIKQKEKIKGDIARKKKEKNEKSFQKFDASK